MKRRGFLGLMGGAVVAGPSTATKAVARLPMGLGTSIDALSTSGMYETPTASGSSDGWKLNRIKTIKRLLTGQKTDEEMEEERRERLYHLRQAAEVRVANLRSLSDSAKISMARREAQRFEDERQKIYLSHELKHLLKGE